MKPAEAAKKIALIAGGIVVIILAVFFISPALSPYIPPIGQVAVVFLLMLGAFIVIWRTVASDQE